MPSRHATPIRPRPHRDFRGDREGVTEVIGYILVFGILSMILLLSLLAFNLAQEAARERAVELRAESAAARVAGVVVQTAVLAEQESASAPTILYSIDLPDDLEGYAYELRLEQATTVDVPTDCVRGAHADQVCVWVPALELAITAPLFSAGAPANLQLCDSTTPGGSIQVVFDVSASCSGAKGIFLQVTP